MAGRRVLLYSPLQLRTTQINVCLQVLREVQSASRQLYPPGAMDDLSNLELKLFGTGDDAGLDNCLLEKVMEHLTNEGLPPRVKVALLQCFTLLIDRHRTAKERVGVDLEAVLKDAQIQLASAGATQMVATIVQDADSQVFKAGALEQWREGKEILSDTNHCFFFLLH